MQTMERWYQSFLNEKERYLEPGAPRPEGEKGWTKFRNFLFNIGARVMTSDLTILASQLAYHLIMAAIPIILVLIQAASFVMKQPGSALFNWIEALPNAVIAIVRPILTMLVESVSGATITTGLLVAIWLASKGIQILINTINNVIGLEDQERNFLWQRAYAVFFTVLLMGLIAAVLYFKVYNDIILKLIGDVSSHQKVLSTAWSWTSEFLKSMAPYAVLMFMLAYFYKVAPATSKGQKIPMKAVFVGATISSLAIFIVTRIYAFIMDNVSKWSLYFGSLAGILSLFVWLLMVCKIIVLGAQVIAAYMEVYEGIDYRVAPEEGGKNERNKKNYGPKAKKNRTGRS